MDPQKRPPMRLIKLVLIVWLYPLSESTNVEMQFWHSHEVVQILEWYANWAFTERAEHNLILIGVMRDILLLE